MSGSYSGSLRNNSAPSANPCIHGELLASLIPNDFNAIRSHLTRFLHVLGEERCEKLYTVCEELTEDEISFVFRALSQDINKLLNHNWEKLDQNTLDYTDHALLAAAYAAPVVQAWGHMESETVKQDTLWLSGIRGLLRAVGDVINVASADSLVVDIPDMNRHDLVIFRGAVAAIMTPNPYGHDRASLQYLGENWRALAPHAKTIEKMSSFDIPTGNHLLGGGSVALIEGAL